MDHEAIARRCDEICDRNDDADMKNLAGYVAELARELKRQDQELWELRHARRPD